MENRYTILQHETRTFYLVDCPILLVSHAITKDNQNNTIFVQCKFENTLSKPIKALYISVKCYDVTNQSLSDVESFSYLDILVNQYETFGDKTPVILPDKETRNISIIPVKIVFEDGSTWENRTNLSFVEFEYNNTTISELGELAEEYRRELHHICLQSDRHNYLPIRKDGYTVCGCGKIVVEAEKTCPACGVDLEKLFALNDVDKLQAGLEQYEKEKREQGEKLKAKKIEQEIALEHKRKKQKKYIKICCLIVVIGLVTLGAYRIISSITYKKSFEKVQEAANIVSAGGIHSLALNSDGSVVANGDNSFDRCNVGEWENIESVYAGSMCSFGLRSNGTVLSAGDNDFGQCDVENWTDIIAISAGDYHTVGLKSDGTVVATGSNQYGQCDVDGWTDIIAISTGSHHTIGLKKSGAVLATGYDEMGQCNVDDWENVIAISAYDDYSLGVKKDGTVVAAGDNYFGQCDVADWRDIIAIGAGGMHSLGLKADGTLVATGGNYDGQCDVEEWTDIIAISAGSEYSLGLKSDGAVVATGNNDYGQCNVSDWDLW